MMETIARQDPPTPSHPRKTLINEESQQVAREATTSTPTPFNKPTDIRIASIVP